VFCALAKGKVSTERTVTDMTYADMLELWLWPQQKDFTDRLSCTDCVHLNY